jgi:hypothetical protein
LVHRKCREKQSGVVSAEEIAMVELRLPVAGIGLAHALTPRFTVILEL